MGCLISARSRGGCGSRSSFRLLGAVSATRTGVSLGARSRSARAQKASFARSRARSRGLVEYRLAEERPEGLRAIMTHVVDQKQLSV